MSHDRSQAIITYLGRGTSPYPVPDSGRLKAAFGDRAPELEVYVVAVLRELAGVQVDWSSATLVSGSDAAVDVIASRHPELSEEALSALRWKFSYDWR